MTTQPFMKKGSKKKPAENLKFGGGLLGQHWGATAALPAGCYQPYWGNAEVHFHMGGNGLGFLYFYYGGM